MLEHCKINFAITALLLTNIYSNSSSRSVILFTNWYSSVLNQFNYRILDSVKYSKTSINCIVTMWYHKVLVVSAYLFGPEFTYFTNAVQVISGYQQNFIYNDKPTVRNTVILSATESDRTGNLRIGNYQVNVTGLLLTSLCRMKIESINILKMIAHKISFIVCSLCILNDSYSTIVQLSLS